jgi:heme-degrading monooxygenase HmoA
MSGVPDPLAQTPKPPYYAVIFTSRRTAADPEGYDRTADRMVELAATMPGFLGIESARNSEGVGITVSYWDSLDSIRRWREHAEHRLAQRAGKERFYERYFLRVCRVEKAYDFCSAPEAKTHHGD